ncbi:hypothetical protein [Thalassolituus oleivorans]|uniref:hypothetical protein n=1 Tax=Thalassolituus oleivorans TaxID=187493 RepID=UPI00042DBB06|nr:hypothetical protein [Thalassolituus oleivorans]AHK16283.1 metal-binding protein [Thalassolituus oleivorans R6-15]
MPREAMCNCNEQPTLIDISENYSDFKSKLQQLVVGDWVLLMQCPDCKQLYRVDECDKYQTCYAVKIPSRENWEAFDSESLIREQIVQNRGGLTNELCMWSGCDIKQVKGSAYCANHLYSGGARE